MSSDAASHPYPPQDPGGSRGGGGYGPMPVALGSLADKLRVAASKGQLDKVQDLLQAGAGFEPDRVSPALSLSLSVCLSVCLSHSLSLARARVCV